MSDQTSASVPVAQPARPRRRIGLWIMATLAVLFAATLIALPYVIEDQAVKWLERNGADKAHIEDVDLNLFEGSFQIDNLVVQKQDHTPLRIWQLAGDLNWLDLLDKRVVVQTLWLYGSHLSVVQNEQGELTIGGITLPEPAADQPAATEAAAPTMDLSAWDVGVNAFVLANATVEYRAPRLEQDLYATVLYLLNMHSWEPDRPAQFGLDMHVNNQPFKISSDVRAFADDPDTVASLNLEELNLADFAALADLGGVRDLSGKLSLKLAVDAVHRDKSQTRVDIKGDVVLRDLRAVQGETSIAQGLLHYAGDFTVHLGGAADVPMADVKGKWESKDSFIALGDLSVKHAALGLQTTTSVFKAESETAPMVIHSKVAGSVDSLLIDDTKQSIRLADVRRVEMAGVDVQFPQSVSVTDVTIGETRALESLTKDGPGTGLPEISLKTLRLSDAVYDFAKQAVSVAAVEVARARAHDQAKGLTLGELGSVKLAKLDLKLKEGASVGSVDLADVRALRPDAAKEKRPPAVVTVAKTSVQKIGYTFEPARLEIASIGINGLKGEFVREADGSLYGLAQFASTDEAPIEAAPDKAAPSAPAADKAAMTIRLGALSIDDNAEIHWTDHHVKPRATVTVKPFALKVGAFDTADPRGRTDVSLSASLHKNNEITFKGHVSPLDAKPNSKLDGAIKRLELTGFGPYAAAAGYNLRSGRLDADITANATEGELDMLNKLTLTKLRLEGGGGDAKRSATGGATALPLNVALGYLRDSEDRIKLDVPVTGNIRDPQFSFNDVIRLATQAAAQQAAMSYLTAALQPLGTVLLVGKLASGAVNAMQLQPIEFAPGDATLSDTAGAYVEKIAGILKDRPGIKLSVCGSATESDRAAMLDKQAEQAKLMAEKAEKSDKARPQAQQSSQEQVPPTVSDDQLLLLADERSKQVREQLLEKHQVNPDQLFDCRPVLEADAEAVPQVTLAM